MEDPLSLIANLIEIGLFLGFLVQVFRKNSEVSAKLFINPLKTIFARHFSSNLTVLILNAPSKRLSLSLQETFTHTHIIGATSSGKSKFLEYIICRDIEQGNGICLIDPDGFLSSNLNRLLNASGKRN